MRRSLSSLTALCLLSASALAQSDDCFTAPLVPTTGLVPFTNVGATSGGALAPCNMAGGGSRDAWFKWVGNEATRYTFRVCDADYDVVISLWAGCGVVPLDCSDRNGCGTTSLFTAQIDIDLPPLLPLYIQVDGWDGAQGSGTLEIIAHVGETYCDAGLNSLGLGAQISATGSPSIMDNQLTLEAVNVPNQPGVFFHGANQSAIPFGNTGLRCTTGDLRRSSIVFASGHVARRTIDLPSVGITVPAVRYFQYWYRDPGMGPDFFNTSNGTKILFFL